MQRLCLFVVDVLGQANGKAGSHYLQVSDGIIGFVQLPLVIPWSMTSVFFPFAWYLICFVMRSCETLTVYFSKVLELKIRDDNYSSYYNCAGPHKPANSGAMTFDVQTRLVAVANHKKSAFLYVNILHV